VTNKTYTVVAIKKITLSFTQSLIVEGLYLEDLKKDTLLYAGNVSISIALFDLLHKNIHIRSFHLQDLVARINRSQNDSLFNYSFLLKAFADSSSGQQIPKTTSQWTFTLDKVSLSNIHLLYSDAYGGSLFDARLHNLSLTLKSIDLAKMAFTCNKLVVDGLNATVCIKAGKSQSQIAEAILPSISAHTIQIENTEINFVDSINEQSIHAHLGLLQLIKASVELQKQAISLQTFALSKSNICYTMNKLEGVKPNESVSDTFASKIGWSVLIKHIKFDDNAFSYGKEVKLKLKKTFDVDNLAYRHFSFIASGFYYTEDSMALNVTQCSTIDENQFTLRSFESDFRMDKHSIKIRNLKLSTNNSSIDASIVLGFSSLQSLQDSIQNLKVNIQLCNASIQNGDILYFDPDLQKLAFFKALKNKSTLKGNIRGTINNLVGNNLIVTTGLNTRIATNCSIKGLPAIDKTLFDFPNLSIITGRKDIEMIVDTLVPKSIAIPEKATLLIVYKGRLRSFHSTINMQSSIGSAQAYVVLDDNGDFTAKTNLLNLDIGFLLKNKALYGPITMDAEMQGQGLYGKTISAAITAKVPSVYLNTYTYHNLTIQGHITGKAFDGKIQLADENAAFDFDGKVNLNPKQEAFVFNLNVAGLNLQKLHVTNNDLRIGFSAQSSISGASMNGINGNATVSNIAISHAGKIYILDSILFSTINKPGESEFSINSSLIDAHYTGSSAPTNLAEEFGSFLNHYFPFSKEMVEKKAELSDFMFDIHLHNHPIISEVFVPELKAFEVGTIEGHFSTKNHILNLTASVKNIVYGSIVLNDFNVDIHSNEKAIHYSIACQSLSNETIKVDTVLLAGTIEDGKISTNISSVDNDKNKKFFLHSELTKDNANFKLTLDSNDFYLMNKRWNIAADNYILFGKQGFLIHNLSFSQTGSMLALSSVHSRFNDDLSISIKHFNLFDIAGIIAKDSSLINGILDAKILLTKDLNNYKLTADVSIDSLQVKKIPIGNVTVKVENQSTEKLNADIIVRGIDNNLSTKGSIVSSGNEKLLNFNTEIQSLSMKTIQAFSMNEMSDASGTISGVLSIDGTMSKPTITGQLTVDSVLLTPTVLHNPLHIKHETIQIKNDGIYFNSFTIFDKDNHSAKIDGAINMNAFQNFGLSFRVKSKDFLLLNTTIQDNKDFYGKIIIDSKISIDGPLSLPVINGSVKLKKGSNITVAVPADSLTNDKGKDVVLFENSKKTNPILMNTAEKQLSGLTGFDISSIIEIDKEATLRLLVDPSSSDSLVVKGDAALSFALDRSGKMSLTGAYNINEGSYVVSLESIIKRKFAILSESSINWNGDPKDATISINASYSVRASPIDLVAGEMSDLTEADKNTYKERYPFTVVLKLRGAMLHPDISFEIQLEDKDKGILNGAVDAKLTMVNADPSAINKQVFALLVLGRFVQENPLQSASGSTETVVRSTVGTLLSAQLNQLSEKMIKSVALNVDIQSYDDYQSGQAQGRSQVDLGVKKELFNDRLSVEVGGSVDVEGEKAKQNSASDFTSDFTIEYKVTNDGRYRLKGFRHNQFENPIDGQLIETGAGLLFVREFNAWRSFLKAKKKEVALKNKEDVE
jgi:hypothetical protein